MKFCDIKTAERQGKPAKAGWKAPDEPVCRRLFGRFHVTSEGRYEKHAWTVSKALTVVYTTLCGLFARQIMFFVKRRIHAIIDDRP